jgi:hypothetical protein
LDVDNPIIEDAIKKGYLRCKDGSTFSIVDAKAAKLKRLMEGKRIKPARPRPPAGAPTLKMKHHPGWAEPVHTQAKTGTLSQAENEDRPEAALRVHNGSSAAPAAGSSNGQCIATEPVPEEPKVNEGVLHFGILNNDVVVGASIRKGTWTDEKQALYHLNYAHA